MSEQAGDEMLRQAFQALGARSGGECSDEDRDRVWRAVSGDMPADERRTLVERLATDPGLAEAWRVADELWSASQGAAARVADTPARLWRPTWLAAAALLVLAVGAGVVIQDTAPAEDEFRSGGGYVVESLVPFEATLPRENVRLRWSPGPEGSRYAVRVTTEDLRVLDTATDLTVPELVVAPERFAAIPPGTRVLWQVDAALPGGGTVSSRTFVARVQ